MERRTGGGGGGVERGAEMGEERMEIQRGRKGWRYRERMEWREGQKGREEGMEEWGDGRGRDGGMGRWERKGWRNGERDRETRRNSVQKSILSLVKQTS